MYLFNDITLLVTHYNRPASLERLLRSFAEMGCRFHEIIVSDDASAPSNLEVIRTLADYYSFRVITAARNMGLGHNINKGQRAVHTPYTLYVQEDFIPTPLFPEKLQQAFQMMDQDKDLDLARFYAYFRYPYLRPAGDGFSEMIFRPWYRGYKKFYSYSDHPHLRRSTFPDKFGSYKEGLRSDKTEYEMMMNFLKKKGKGLFFEEYQSLFIQKNSGDEPSTVHREFWRTSTKFPISQIRNIYRHLKFNYDLFLRLKIQN